MLVNLVAAADVVPVLGLFKIQYHQLGLLGSVPGSDGADELGVVGADPPHDATGAAGLQRHEVTDELACKKGKTCTADNIFFEKSYCT